MRHLQEMIGRTLRAHPITKVHCKRLTVQSQQLAIVGWLLSHLQRVLIWTIRIPNTLSKLRKVTQLKSQVDLVPAHYRHKTSCNPRANPRTQILTLPLIRTKAKSLKTNFSNHNLIKLSNSLRNSPIRMKLINHNRLPNHSKTSLKLSKSKVLRAYNSNFRWWLRCLCNQLTKS